MSTYPVLNDQPIDQWKIMDLKDELCRRNLPINGLKEDLVKRLFEDLQGDILDREGIVGGSSPVDDLKGDETTGSADVSVCQAATEPSIDENPSLVSAQNHDLVVSVKEASKQSTVAAANVSQGFVVTTEEVSQITLPAAEVTDAPLVDLVTTDKVYLSGAVATTDDLESVPSDSTVVMDVHEQAGGHSELIAENALEEDAGNKMIVDYLTSNVASTDVKLDVTPAKGKLDGDILEHEEVSTGSADLSVCQAAIKPSIDEHLSLVSEQNRDLVISVKEASNGSTVATANVSQEFVVTTEDVGQATLPAAKVSDAPLVDVVTSDKIYLSGTVVTKDGLESVPSDSTVVKDVHEQAGGHNEFIAEKALEEDAGKKTIVDYLKSNVASTDVKLDVTPAKGKLDDDILEHGVVSSPPDASVPHADHWDVDAVANALGNNVDALIPKTSSSENDLMNCKDHKGSGHTSSACKPTLSGPIDQTSGILAATMSTYPVLNNRPIDQWKVTELKDELCRRNLPIKGLKEDLLERLFEDLEGDVRGVSPPDHDLKEDGTPVFSNASVYQDAIEQNVGEDPSKVATQEGEPGVSVTEVSKENADATGGVSQDAVVTTEEVSQISLVAATDSDAPLFDSATADKISLSDAVATKGDDLESAPSDITVVKRASPQSDLHTEIIAEKAPEEGTVKKVIVDYLPYDVSTNVKFDATSAKGKLDSDSVEQGAIPSPPDAIVPHTDHLDVHAIATAPGQNAETLIPKIDSGDNAFMDGKDHKDSGRTNGAGKPSLSGTKDQVSEANPALGSQIKCVLISHDNISTNVKGDRNADNSDFELEAKRDMVKPPCSIHSIGDDLQALDDCKELAKNATSLQEIEYATNMKFDKKQDSPDGTSSGKLNLDRSPGNEQIEEDVMESKHVIPNIRSDDLGRETEVTSYHEVKEVTLFDTDDSSVQTKDIVAEDKPVTPSEKRKPEDQVVAVDPIKRQRRVDNVKLPKEQASKSSSDSPKDVPQPVLKLSFGRSVSTTSGDSHRERIVPLSQQPATTSLRIDRFVRPFTLKAVQELLGTTGSICSFWMDDIKTHCYVTYSSVDEAVATRHAVYNLQWPPNNGNYLVAKFVDPHEVKLKLERPPPPPVLISLSTDTAPKAEALQQSKANQTMLPHGAGTSRGLLPVPQPLPKLFRISKPVSGREMLPPPPKKPETRALSLDDIFKRTQASPMIYYLPLSEEEVAEKLAARSKRRRRG